MSEKTAGEVYKKNIGSMVAITTQQRMDTQPMSVIAGSGIVVGDNEVVTNCHVIDDGSPIMVLQPGDGMSASPNRHPARIVASSLRDLCLLKTEGLSAPAAELGQSASAEIGNPVYAIGHPSGVYGTLSSGIVSQTWEIPVDSGEWSGRGIQTTTPLSGGSSGGGLFDGAGRLIGITTGRIGQGESLHSSLPVELVAYLRQRVGAEAPLHKELSAALDNPSPEKFRELADRIVESLGDPVSASFARRLMGDHDALFGDKKAAARQAKLIRALADSLSGEQRDQILVDAVQITADIGEIESAMKLAAEIGEPWRCAQAFAHIVRELAGVNISEARKLCEERIPLEAMLEKGNPKPPPPECLVEFLGEVASARAATEDSEEALRIADWMIRQHPDNTAWGAEILARIAYQLRRQNVLIGASALFHFAGNWAMRDPDMSQQLVGLTIMAYHAARGGDHDEARHALQHVCNIEEKREGGDYNDRLIGEGNAAEAHALIGDVDGAIGRIKRIPVFGDVIPSALVCVAAVMSR